MSATKTWHIEGHGKRSGGQPAYYVATLYEGGVPSRIISALLREDLEWVITHHNAAQQLAVAVQALEAIVDDGPAAYEETGSVGHRAQGTASKALARIAELGEVAK